MAGLPIDLPREKRSEVALTYITVSAADARGAERRTSSDKRVKT